MTTTHKPSSLIISAFALAYAIFLIWWLNRPEGQPPLTINGSQNSASFAETKPAALLLPTASGRAVSGAASGKSAQATDGRSSQAGARESLFTNPVRPNEMPSFKPILYTEGQPHYDGEPVTAYVRVGSTRQQAALTVNQGGEYPQLLTAPGEEVQVRLAFTRTEPDSPIALTAQDGGTLQEGTVNIVPLIALQRVHLDTRS